MTDLRLELKIKNKALWEVTVGSYGSVARFCQAHGHPQRGGAVGSFLSMQRNPYEVRWGLATLFVLTRVAAWVCEVTGLDAVTLFPVYLYEKPFPKLMATNVEGSVFLPLLSAPRELRMLPSPEDDQQKNDLARVLATVIDQLSAREQKVIKSRFGFDGPELTLRECAEQYGVTPERIRQIEAKAMRKLRHPRSTRQIRAAVTP